MFKKMIYFVAGFSILCTLGGLLFTGYISNLVSDPDKIGKITGKSGMNQSPVGLQPPEWRSGVFSPDGKYYVYTYSITDVKSYHSRFGASTSVRFYLQVIDAPSGVALLEEAIQLQGAPTIVSVDNNALWLSVYNIKEDKASPVLYQIGAKQLKYTARDFKRINPHLPVLGHKGVLPFYACSGHNGDIIIEANDARQYLIEAATGKFSRTPLVKTPLTDKGQRNLQTVSTVPNYTEKGDSRQYIIKKDTQVRSTEDFIDPRFVIRFKEAPLGEPTLFTYTHHIFILSNTSTISHQDKQLSMLDSETLKTIWTLDLPQESQEANTYDVERFAMQEQTLFAVNKTHYFLIDAQKGAIIKSTHLNFAK